MNLGKFIPAALAVLALAVVAAGCGDADTSGSESRDQSAITATDQTGSTDEDGPGSDESKESDGTDQTAKGTESSSDSGSKSSKESSKKEQKDSKSNDKKSNNKSNGNNQPAPVSRGVDVPPAVKRELTIAWNRLLSAMNNGDVDYICGTAYSSDYLAELNSKGGCKKVTEQGLASVEGFEGSIRGINLVNSNLGEVYVTLTRKTSGKDVTAEPAIHFKKQNGQWKRFIYTGENG
ncbi:MAG: hypothetical protein ACPGWS_00410 [Solirubrobacterales bacterium]